MPHRLLNKAEAVVASLAARLPGTSLQVGPPRHLALATDPWPGVEEPPPVRVHEILPERTATRQPPIFADPAMEREAGPPAAVTIKRVFVGELPRGRYWGRHFGYVIDRHDRLIADLAPTFTRQGRHDGLNHPWLPRVREVPGTVAVINTRFSDNFHHWLLDTVPRFHWLEQAGWKLGDIGHFIVPAQRAPYHRETYARLGLDEARLISQQPRLHLRADRLLAPSDSEPSFQPALYNYTPEGLAYVRDLFLRDNPHSTADRPKRILVSREKAAVRRLVQRERAEDLLGRLGFTKLLLEDISVAEQAAAFEAAECVIMPTGGNLANLVFCRPGTVVIELFSPGYLPTFNYALMGPLGLRYYALVADKVSRPWPGASGSEEDIDVDPERLAAIARQAIGTSGPG